MTTLYLRDRWFEDLPVGEFHVFGSHTFSELEIVDFAQQFDPRPESTNPEKARDYGDWPLREGSANAAFAFLSELAPFMSAHASVPGVLGFWRAKCEGRDMDHGRWTGSFDKSDSNLVKSRKNRDFF